jgi:gamma-glutamylputrescine oxidase
MLPSKKFNMNRRSFIKHAGLIGAGYVMGRYIPKHDTSNEEHLEHMIDQSFNTLHTGTYYQSSQKYHPSFPKLDQHTECDVCIIGGGLTGITTALNLAHQDHQVILVEANTLARQASGSNGGQVLNSYECEMSFFEDHFGEELAKYFWALSLEGVQSIKSNIKKYSIDCGWKSGTGIVAYKENHIKDLEEEYDDRKQKYNYQQLRLYNAKQTKDIIGSNIYHGLLYDEGNGHLNPLNYALALAEELKKAPNIRIYEHSKASHIEFDSQDRHKIIINEKHSILAKKIILAANFGNSHFLPELKKSTLPLETFILVTEPIEKNHSLSLKNIPIRNVKHNTKALDLEKPNEHKKQLIKNNMSVFDTRNVMDYYRLTETGQLLFGGGDAFGAFNVKNVQHGLYKQMMYVFPEISGIKVQNFWAGQESMTINLAPSVGEAFDGTVRYALGYSGQGLALSHLFGRIMADAINGNTKDFDLFAQIKHTSLVESPTLRHWMVNLGVEYYRFLDKWF